MRILLVEDNLRLAETVCEGLRGAGLEIDAVQTAEDALSVISTQTYDAMILDLGLPDIDGMQVLQKLRSANNSLPVLVLTARGTLSDKVSGLDKGADDYMVKPFEMSELTARVRALLRRPSHSTGMVASVSNLSFNTVKRYAQIGEQIMDLSRRETDLLEQLILSTDKVVTKKAIEERIYSYGDVGSANSVEALVSRLRKKLAQYNAKVSVHTLKGVGYMLTGGQDGG